MDYDISTLQPTKMWAMLQTWAFARTYSWWTIKDLLNPDFAKYETKWISNINNGVEGKSNTRIVWTSLHFLK